MDSIRHKDQRANIPTEELRDFVASDEKAPKARADEKRLGFDSGKAGGVKPYEVVTVVMPPSRHQHPSELRGPVLEAIDASEGGGYIVYAREFRWVGRAWERHTGIQTVLVVAQAESTDLLWVDTWPRRYGLGGIRR